MQKQVCNRNSFKRKKEKVKDNDFMKFMEDNGVKFVNATPKSKQLLRKTSIKTLKNKGKVKKPECWQKHHVSYEPEVLVRVTRAEHYYLTCLMRFNAFSKGFRESLREIMAIKPIKREQGEL